MEEVKGERRDAAVHAASDQDEIGKMGSCADQEPRPAEAFRHG